MENSIILPANFEIDYDADLLDVPNYTTISSHIEEVYPNATTVLKSNDIFNQYVIHYGNIYQESKKRIGTNALLNQDAYLEVCEQIKYSLKDYENQFNDQDNEHTDFDLDLHSVINSMDISLN